MITSPPATDTAPENVPDAPVILPLNLPLEAKMDPSSSTLKGAQLGLISPAQKRMLPLPETPALLEPLPTLRWRVIEASFAAQIGSYTSKRCSKINPLR